MEKIIKASYINARIAPRKARIVIDLIRGKQVVQALGMLKVLNKRAGVMISKLILSAAANARDMDKSAKTDDFIIVEARVDKGRTLKRLRPRAMGRGSLIQKRNSHIYISIEDHSSKKEHSSEQE